MDKLIIDSDGKQFMISCPVWANDLVRDLPNRRWNKSRRAWLAPLVRANVERVQQIMKMDGAITTDKARAAIDKYHSDKESAVKRGSGFPAWYPFKRQPRRHQFDALNKGYGMNAFALFMDMQTGKSKTAIDMVTALHMENKLQAVQIFTKLTLRENWVLALEDDCPIPYSVHCPTTDKPKQFEKWLLTKHPFKIMIVGWESLSTGGMADMCERFLMAHHPTAIIGDETNYIMTHTATRAQVAEKLARKSEYRYALTGTPATEGLIKLYQQFEFLDPDIIGTGDFYAFRNRYATMGGYIPKDGPMRGKPTQIVGYQNVDELMELIAPYSFQVVKDDAYDLPPKRYQVRELQMTKEQAAAYKIIKREQVIGSGDDERAVSNTLELMLRLHQVAGGYTVKPRENRGKMEYDPVELVTPDKNPKIIEVQSILEEIKGRKQALIWAVYLPEIRALIATAKAMGFRVGELHGGVPEKERQPQVAAFKRGELDLIIGNASTGGMGYSMHTAEVNIFYNNTFKLRDRLQAEDRSWGDGQTKPGIWIDLVMAKTVDRTVYDALKNKEDLHHYVRSRIKHMTALLDGEHTGQDGTGVVS